jgi:hypothetical protein
MGFREVLFLPALALEPVIGSLTWSYVGKVVVERNSSQERSMRKI